MSAEINSFTQTMWDQFLCVRPIITTARTSSGEYTIMKAILLICVGGFSLFWSYIVSHVLSSGSFKFYYKKRTHTLCWAIKWEERNLLQPAHSVSQPLLRFLWISLLNYSKPFKVKGVREQKLQGNREQRDEVSVHKEIKFWSKIRNAAFQDWAKLSKEVKNDLSAKSALIHR